MAGIAQGTTQLSEAEGSKSVTVPVTAVFSPEATEQSFVWVIDEATMTAGRRPVTVESLTDTGVTIAEGLQPGEWIATAGVHYLAEGQKVRILKTPED
jgi:multidrug efflux pump subunit AcrA (membrane-fusion protein)